MPTTSYKHHLIVVVADRAHDRKWLSKITVSWMQDGKREIEFLSKISAEFDTPDEAVALD